jgi:hypothetical protein
VSSDFWSNLKVFLPDVQAIVQALLTNSVVIGVIAWLAKIWADRRIGEQAEKLEQLKGVQAQKIEEIKGSQTAQLESLKGDITNLGRKFQASMEQRMLVFRTHFDIEFKAYQDIWAKCDEAADLAAMTLGYVQRVPVDDAAREEERIDAIRRYDVCREALIEVRKKRPFVTKEISDLSREVIARCIHVMDIYRDAYPNIARNNHEFDRRDVIREIKKKVDELINDFDRLGDLISSRISELYTTNT